MKLRDLSIRSKLLTILLLMVVVPTVLLGTLSYNTVRNELTDSTQKELTISAQNWQSITYAYVQQEDRVLKREQALVEQRLETSALTAKRVFESSVGVVSSENIYTDLSKISIGRAGYVFVLDTHGIYKLSKGRLRDGENLWEAADEKGTKIIQQLVADAVTLAPEDTHATTYQWKEIGDTKVRDQLVVVSYSKKYNLIFGAAMYYSEFKSNDLKLILQDELRARMSAQKIKENGYIWAIDSKGNYLVSKDKIRDGENILSITDTDGTPIIKEVIAAASKLGLGETYKRAFAWKNIGESAPRAQLTAFTYVPEWDWIIGASAYNDDYLKSLSSIRLYILLICGLAISIGAIVAYLFAGYITRPVKKLEDIAHRAEMGDLSVQVGEDLLKEGAEIGSLAKSFNSMITKLFGNISRLDSSNKELAESTERIASKNNELERLNRLMVDRELKMVELKKQNEALQVQLKSNIK